MRIWRLREPIDDPITSRLDRWIARYFEQRGIAVARARDVWARYGHYLDELGLEVEELSLDKLTPRALLVAALNDDDPWSSRVIWRNGRRVGTGGVR